jgi:hypothetical protein
MRSRRVPNGRDNELGYAVCGAEDNRPSLAFSARLAQKLPTYFELWGAMVIRARVRFRSGAVEPGNVLGISNFGVGS